MTGRIAQLSTVPSTALFSYFPIFPFLFRVFLEARGEKEALIFYSPDIDQQMINVFSGSSAGVHNQIRRQATWYFCGLLLFGQIRRRI